MIEIVFGKGKGLLKRCECGFDLHSIDEVSIAWKLYISLSVD